MKSCESLFVLQSCGKRIKKLHARSWQGESKQGVRKLKQVFRAVLFLVIHLDYKPAVAFCLLTSNKKQKTLFLFAGIK